MSKKTKANKKKRLDSLLLILLLTAVLLIMSTYAWFTANRTVKVDTIDVYVATSSGLQISADAIDWKTVINKENITDASGITDTATYTSNVNQIPDIMSPISTDLTLDSSGHLTMYYGDVEADLEEDSDTYGDYLLTSILQEDVATYTLTDDDYTANEYAAGYYLAFDVFLKVDTPSDTLYMSGSVVDNTDENNGSSGTSKGLQNAARVALIKSATVNTDADTYATSQALSTAGGTVTLWEPNYDSHTAKAIENYQSLGWDDIFGLTFTEGSGNAYLSYDGLKSEFENIPLQDALSSNYSDYFTTVTPDYATTTSELPSYDLGGIEAGVTKYRIYLWVEGQDIDCENNASGTYLFLNLSFSLDPFTSTGD